MKPTDRKRFGELVYGMAAIKPSANSLTKESVELFWRAMQDWTIEEFSEAASYLLSASKFMPGPFEFNELRRAGEPTCHEAWDIALKACVNWRDASKLPQGRIARAAESVGGFRAIAHSDVERDLPHVQRRFIDAYEGFEKVEPVREALPRIAEHGARIALRGPSHIAQFIPKQLERKP